MVELVPWQAAPYKPEQEIWVSVVFHVEEPLPRYQFLELDTGDTDTAIRLTGEFIWTLGEFPWWYTNGTYPHPYTSRGYLPPWCPFVGCWEGPADWNVGIVAMRVPAHPGQYRLDVLNADPTDTERGAVLQVQSNIPNDSSAYWYADTGELRGGSYEFVVVPEPGTWLLLVLGAVFAARKREQLSRASSWSRP